ncbi:MAG: DUF4328 domain-containing protein [Planctomycetaceae bacterium]
MSPSDSDNTLRVECPGCSKVIRAPRSKAGKTGKCPACGHRVQIPGTKPRSETAEGARTRKPRTASTSSVSNDFPADGKTVASGKHGDHHNVAGGIQVLESRALQALWLIRLTMGMMATQCFILWRLYEGGQSNALMIALAIVFGLQFLLLVSGVVFFLRWKYQASANLHQACTKPLRFTPSGCCWYYFIPILNLFYPIRALNEIQSRSKARVGYMVYIWWLLWILASLIARASFDISRFEAACVVSVAALCVAIVSGFFLTRIIQVVTEKQRRYRLAIV